MRKLFCFMILFFSMLLTAQPPTRFYTRFGGYGHDIGYSVVQTLNGQYAVAGSTSSFGSGNTDVYLALVDSMGWVRWEKSYGGFNNDIGKSIIQLQDSGFVIAGYTNSIGNGGYDVFVVRTDKNGNLIWQKAYGGLDWDFGYAVKATPAGDSLVVCGSTYSFGYGKSDGYILKLDGAGNFLWQKTYGGPEDDEFKSFVMTYNNLYAFAGKTNSMGDLKGDTWLVKTGLKGDSVLGIKYGSNNKTEFINKIVETSLNDFLMCGGFDSTGTDSTWSYFINVNENGVLNFKDAFSKHTLKDQQFMTVVNPKNQTYVYVEKEYNSPVGFKIEPTICAFGGPWYQFCNTYGSTDDDIIYDICVTRDKGYVAIGQTNGFNSNLTDVFLVKMDSTLMGSQKIVGINEPIRHDNDFALVFPTIVSSHVNIQLNKNSKEVNMQVIDAIGNLIYTIRLKEKIESVDLQHLSPGFYFIRLQENDFKQTFRIIKTD